MMMMRIAYSDPLYALGVSRHSWCFVGCCRLGPPSLCFINHWGPGLGVQLGEAAVTKHLGVPGEEGWENIPDDEFLCFLYVSMCVSEGYKKIKIQDIYRESQRVTDRRKDG